MAHTQTVCTRLSFPPAHRTWDAAMGGARSFRSAAATLCKHSQLPQMVRGLVVASNKNGWHWCLLLSTVVLVECLHMSVLWRDCHAVQVSTVTDGLGEGEQEEGKGSYLDRPQLDNHKVKLTTHPHRLKESTDGVKWHNYYDRLQAIEFRHTAKAAVTDYKL